MDRYFIIYKPYKMLSQFVPVKKKRCLSDLDFNFPEGTNALGRLDDNSEGLLILSTDKKLNRLLLLPGNKHKRIYWVQVWGKVMPETISKLEQGLSIRLGKENYVTLPCEAKILETPKNLPDRAHPVSPGIATTWLEIILTEGKFHQLRKMVASVGHQCMRLIRVSIEGLKIPEMKAGAIQEIRKKEVYSLLNIRLKP